MLPKQTTAHKQATPFAPRLVSLERAKSAPLQPLEAVKGTSAQSRYAGQFPLARSSSNAYASTSQFTLQEEPVILDREPQAQLLTSAADLTERLQRQFLTTTSGLLDNVNSSDLLLPGSDQLARMGLLFPIQTQTKTQPETTTAPEKEKRNNKDPKKREDFYANVGEAIRVLRSEIPTLFQKDLSYHIYRDDIVFKDPRNSFQGMKDYKTIFWSLRFHGALFFKGLYVDVLRIWESPKNPTDAGTVLKMRWSVHGVPRVPWDAEGVFDGISTFKLDSSGKIFEHEVNNVILRDPPKEGNPFLAGLNLIRIPQSQQTPCPGAWFQSSRHAEELNNGAQS